MKMVKESPLDWAITVLPQFPEKRALVLPGAFYGNVVSLFAEAGFAKASSVSDADVIVFTGGCDISPHLYGESRNKVVGYVDDTRDQYEKRVYFEAVKAKKVLFGICRGAQFLHAMNGGKLWQDVNNHGGVDHVIHDIEENVTLTANSIHHQMIKNHRFLDIIAITKDKVADRFTSQHSTIRFIGEENRETEIEAGCYWDSRCIFVQGHPEIGSPEYRAWCMSKLNDFMAEIAHSEDKIRNEVSAKSVLN
jgi:GMP synthase-like glutamine amidotransferase